MQANRLSRIRVMLPFHLQTLAGVGPEVQIDVAGTPTQQSLIAALETRYPTLSGAIFDPLSRKRRPLIRFFACQQDISFEPQDRALPAAVVEGKEAFFIVGAISGG